MVRHVRAYLTDLADRELSDSYIHGHARAILTLDRFLYSENYLSEPVTFQRPTIAKKRLPVLSSDEVKRALESCSSIRDKVIIYLLVDPGLRREEALALNWGDVNIKRGFVRVAKGKVGKSRGVVIGVTTRRALLAYRREVNHEEGALLIQTKNGGRLTPMGLRSALLRIGKRADLHLSPHALRRRFASLSLKAGRNIIHLQSLLRHSSLENIQMLDDDLLDAHKEHGLIDSFFMSHQF